jgi:ubiquinone/menaquinone biosynthesis C-methylase UbiE
MNVFLKPEVAVHYEEYYRTDAGKKVDAVEKKLIAGLLEHIPVSDMLELGCGTGHWTEFFLEKGFRVTAVDNSGPMLKVAREKKLRADFRKLDVHKLPYADEQFPVVSSITMLEFVDDREKVLREIYRVLQPGGWLLLGCLNAQSEMGRNREKDEVFHSAFFYTPESLRKQLTRFGDPEINYGVYFSSSFEILDGKAEANTVEPAFMAVQVKKIR